MAFCPSCGKQAEGRFCASCGATIGAAATPPEGNFAPPPPPTGGIPNPPYTPNASTDASALPENAASALCYLLGAITGVLFLVLEPYSRNPRIKFHAMQAILFTVASFAFYIAEMFLFWILPGPLMILLGLLQLVVALAFFGLWLFMMWKTYQGEKIVLPIIGPIAESQARV